ncbi:MAG: caa(3)-type oxidase subunit IV [Planctomycetaceae bacterium]|nr:caa(3)-type oxidase subunit IV [Planctomycetaceae bacterium]
MANTSEAHHDAHSASHAHPLPMKIMIGVILALLVLTWITYAASTVDFGAANVFVALCIAVIKASLVGLFFMHLRYDNMFYGLILICALGFVALFIAVTLTDTIEYNPDMAPAAQTAQP